MKFEDYNKLKINDKVSFKYINKNIPEIGSGVVIGHIIDFDGDYAIIKTGVGEHYINRIDIIEKLNIKLYCDNPACFATHLAEKNY